MDKKQGLPEGYDFRSRRPGKIPESEKERIAREKSLRDLYNSVPRASEGEPVQYDEYGIPIVDEPEPQPEAHMPIEDDIDLQMRRAQQEHQRAAGPNQRPTQQQSRPRSPEEFMGSKPASNRMPEEQPQYSAYEDKYQHPILKKMLSRLGLKTAEKHKLVIELSDDPEDTLTYVMTKISDEISLWALNQAQERATTDGGQPAISWFQLLVSCASVVAIDDEPIWKAFGIRPEDYEIRELSEDPLLVPSRIRKITAFRLATIIFQDMAPIGDKLWEFYENRVQGHGFVSSYDRELQGSVRFVCPLDGCKNHHIAKVKYDDDGKVLPYYCIDHGAELVKVTNLREEHNIPLG